MIKSCKPFKSTLILTLYVSTSIVPNSLTSILMQIVVNLLIVEDPLFGLTSIFNFVF